MSTDWNTGGSAWDAGNNQTWTGAAANDNSWTDDTPGAVDPNDGFGSGGFGDAHVAEPQERGAEAGDGCRNCGQDGHFARECPEPRKAGPCFNCGEEGHTKAECQQLRVFKGECNLCHEEGHLAARCPSKPKDCSRCKQKDDHDTKDCKNNFRIDLSDVEDLPEGAAWARIVSASLEKDVDDFKEALRMLQKTAPELTYKALEKRLRAQDMSFYLIALKKDVSDGYTLVNLQGEPDKTYCLGIFKSPDPVRPNMVDKWPESVEDNLEKLADAGIPMERGLSYCRNCETFGHPTRECAEPKSTGEPPKVMCALCGEEGHRVRDCKEPRQKPREPRTCKICGNEDHIAKDCDQKRPPMKCRNCDQEGHKASDCTEPRKLKCSNCDEEGHLRKECPRPMDWEKVVCRHCGEKGHMSASRCAPGAAKKQDDNIGEPDNAGDSGENVGATEETWENGDTSTGGGEWNIATPTPVVSAGAW